MKLSTLKLYLPRWAQQGTGWVLHAYIVHNQTREWLGATSKLWFIGRLISAMDGLTLNEIELRLFLLMKRTASAIERNEAYLSRLEHMNHQRDEFLASLQGRPVLDDERSYRSETETSSISSSNHSSSSENSTDNSSFDSSFDESRDDEETDDSSTGSMECKRHGVAEDLSGSSDPTTKGNSSRNETVELPESVQEEKIQTMLNDLIVNLEHDEKAATERRAKSQLAMQNNESLSRSSRSH